jgi:branched-chain amino acid aminotransferase
MGLDPSGCLHPTTPPPIEGALAGITRALMLDLANREGIPAREEALAPYDLYTAEESFLTGTGAELIPVAAVEGRLLAKVPDRYANESKRRSAHSSHVSAD